MIRLSTRLVCERDGELQRERASPPLAVASPVKEVLALQRTLGNHATAALVGRPPAAPTLQRQISWRPQAEQVYMQSPEALLTELLSEFRHVDAETIKALIQEVESKPARWSPFQAYRGIANALRERYAPPGESLNLTGTNITREEAEWYFLSNFKTFAEVIIDGSHRFEFVNTPDDNHAEDNMMRTLDRFIESKGWDQDFSEAHTILMRINNSPCKRCAPRIYNWNYRDIFVEFELQFANMYEKGNNFTKATTKLRSGGVVVSLMSVKGNLIPLLDAEQSIAKAGLEERARKDQLEAIDWSNWKLEHPH